MFILKNVNIEAKRSKLMLNCESSEAKRTCSIVKKNYFEAKRTCLYWRIQISKRSEHVRSFENLFRSEANMFIFKNLNIEAKRRKLSLICESSEAKRTWLFPKIKLAKRSELVYFKNWQYRSEADRFDSDFVFKKRKKANFRFFKKRRAKNERIR